MGEDGILHLFYPPLTNIIQQLINYFIRDFILNWWDPLNPNQNLEFERVIRARLNGSVHRVEKILLKQERNDLVMATVYGIANVLINHMVIALVFLWMAFLMVFFFCNIKHCILIDHFFVGCW